MEISIVCEPELKQFKPVKVVLGIDKIEDLRLLFHVFNRIDLFEAMVDHEYTAKSYNSNISKHFTDYDLRDIIKDEIKRQGFDL
jgi:hypothetical protein